MGLIKYLKRNNQSKELIKEREALGVKDSQVIKNSQVIKDSQVIKNSQVIKDSQVVKNIKRLQEKNFIISTVNYETYTEAAGVYGLEWMEEVVMYWGENQSEVLQIVGAECDLQSVFEIEEKMENAKLQLVNIEEQIHILRREERLLSESIINFTNIVTEVSSRYKLSPTWEGKKPILIEKQKQLESAKVLFEEKEARINEELERYKQQYHPFFRVLEKACLLYIEASV